MKKEKPSKNIDIKTVQSFGKEWSSFDHSDFSNNESIKIFNEYFSIFPWDRLNHDAEGFDMGCGTGRWAKHVAPRVRKLHVIDPSEAIKIAKENLRNYSNVSFYQESVDDCSLEDASQDFGYSLGVLHHIPDTAAALLSCSRKLKQGAPFLLYLYYNFENRSLLFRLIWQLSNILRKIISILPDRLKNLTTFMIAMTIYIPLSKLSLVLSKFNIDTTSIPLNYYKDHSFYTMQTDARDRFGTPLEHRFSKQDIYSMMTESGFQDIKFSDRPPYWCAIGIKK